MSCKCFCGFIKDIDKFGKEPEFYIKGKTKKTTWLGRIFTFIYFGLYVAFFIYKLVQMIKRVDVTFYDTFAFTGETPSIKLSSDNFYGGFGIMSPFTEDTFVDERYYFAKATFWEGKKVNGRWVWKDTDIPLEKCKLEKFGAKYQEMFAEKNLENLYCLSHVDVTLEGYATSESYNYFEVKLFPCVNTTDNQNCAPIEEIYALLTKNNFQFKMQDIEMTPNDYKSPSQAREKDISGPIYLQLFQQIYAYLQITIVETDEDIIGFGLSDIKTEKFLKYDESWIISAPADPNILTTYGSPLCQITVQLSEKVLTQKRYYTTLIEVLGDVGGLMEVIVSLFSIICSFSTDILYEKTLINNLFEFDVDKKILLIKDNNIKKNNYFPDQNPKIFSMRTRTRIPQKNSIYNQEDNTIQTKNRLNDDGLNKMNNESFLVIKNSKVSGRRARYKVKSSFSSNLGKYESNELKNNKNLFSKNLNLQRSNIYNISNFQDSQDHQQTEKGSGSENMKIIKKINLNKFKVYFCFLCIRRTKNVQNILIDEGMNIINEQLDILNMFKKLYRENKIQEKFSNDEPIEMSDDCKHSLQKFYNFKFS